MSETSFGQVFLAASLAAVVTVTVWWWIENRWLKRQRGPALRSFSVGGLTEQKLNLALAVEEKDPAWCAVHQLISTAETNANQNAAEDIQDPTVMAGYVGGAQHLRMLREELLQRREEGLRLRGALRKAGTEGE